MVNLATLSFKDALDSNDNFKEDLQSFNFLFKFSTFLTDPQEVLLLKRQATTNALDCSSNELAIRSPFEVANITPLSTEVRKILTPLWKAKL